MKLTNSQIVETYKSPDEIWNKAISKPIVRTPEEIRLILGDPCGHIEVGGSNSKETLIQRLLKSCERPDA